MDIVGNILSYNKTFEKQFGYTEQAFKGSFFDMGIKNDTYKLKQYFEKAILGTTQKFNTLGLCKNGRDNRH